MRQAREKRREPKNPLRRLLPQSKASQERTPIFLYFPLCYLRAGVETTDTTVSSLMPLYSWRQVWLGVLATFLRSLYIAWICCPRDTDVSRWNWGYFLQFLEHFHFPPRNLCCSRSCSVRLVTWSLNLNHSISKIGHFHKEKSKTKQGRHTLPNAVFLLGSAANHPHLFSLCLSFRWLEIKSKL